MKGENKDYILNIKIKLFNGLSDLHKAVLDKNSNLVSKYDFDFKRDIEEAKKYGIDVSPYIEIGENPPLEIIEIKYKKTPKIKFNFERAMKAAKSKPHQRRLKRDLEKVAKDNEEMLKKLDIDRTRLHVNFRRLSF